MIIKHINLLARSPVAEKKKSQRKIWRLVIIKVILFLVRLFIWVFGD